MKTKPDGTRAYDLETIGPVPDWWAKRYVKNQIEIRRGIRRRLDESKKPLHHDVFFDSFPLMRDREIREALDAMVADGVLEQDGEFYRRRSVGGERAT
jgi:hypothetical protein